MKAPIIGVTTSETTLELKPITKLNSAYVELVSSHNGIPLLLTQRTPLEHVEQLVSRLDGLILIGGQDIDPAIWGAAPEVEYRENLSGTGIRYCRPVDYTPSRRRDDFEIALYHAAKERCIPIFGICRGLQIINVAEGGSLHQELPEPTTIRHYTENDEWTQHHMIHIDPNTKVGTWMQREQYFTSSIHHQGIDRLGDNLRVSARAEDGVIEIIENLHDERFIVGVHGHIEQTRPNLPLYDILLGIFFDQACALSEIKPAI